MNEVFGWFMRCALQSAAHLTDYVLEEGTAWMCGGQDTERLITIATKAGYLTPVKKKGVRAWKLIDDPDFIHMRLRSEVEWERQQRSDNSNPALTVPARLRDGDACRYCARVVNWRARKGRLAGTYDHRIPGIAATVDTFVVACGACNAGRRDAADADTRYPLLPPPERPYYSSITAAFLTDHGHPTAPTVDEDLRPGSQPDHASDPAASRITHPSDRAASATTHPPHTASTVNGSADRCPPDLDLPGRVGSGRVNSGSVPAAQGTALGHASRRSRRGRPR